MIMNNLNVYCLHKCGSALQSAILKTISRQIKYNFYTHYAKESIYKKNEDTEYKKNEDTDNSIVNAKESPYICLYRKIETIDTDNSIIILRHPLNRSISEYYSFGWTHDSSHNYIYDIRRREEETDRFLKRRQKIQNMSLDDYVVENINHRINEYEIAFDSNGLIIPYEYTMSHPKEYLYLILSKIDNIILVDNLYNELEKEFIFNEDMSSRIIRNEYKGHRRTYCNNKEYKEKLSKCTIDFALSNIGSTLSQYDNLLKQYNIQ